MERLYVVRHGVAVEYGTPGVADDDRPLTEEGERKFRQAAKGLKRLGLEVDRVVTSPLPRARRTAEILVEVLGSDLHLEEEPRLRAGSSASEVGRWLSSRTEERLAIVGHNPWCSDLVELLTTGAERGSSCLCELNKGGVAALRATGDEGWKLDWLATQGLLRRLR